MNSKDIFDGITDIRDDLIDGAKTGSQKKKRRFKKRWFGAIAAVLVLAILSGIFQRPGGIGGGSGIFQRPGGVGGGSVLTAYAIAQAKYPEMAPYPGEPHSDRAFEAWWADVKAQRRDLGDTSTLRSFFALSTRTFLSDTKGQNKICSPLNIYMSLAMLAQLTDGESREQILTLLGSDSMDALRKQASDVWNSNYRDDGALTSILAGSVWLNENVNFRQETMDILAQEFYASSYRGEMGSKEFNRALQEWLNEQTGELLKEQVGNIEMDSETILALATTVYLKAKWAHEFSEKNTAPRTFHSPAGDVVTDFMYQRDDQTYFWGDKFAAVCQTFEEGGSMWFLLPDEGVTPEDLLSDEETLDFLFTSDRWEKQKFLFVNKYVPKFDISSQFDLSDGLQELGITDIFDPAVSDFTSMTTDVPEPVILSQANHAARVVIDEKGCTAAAFTVMLGSGAAMPPDEEVDFILDRPFLFCITGDSGLPMFVGVVNYPAGR